jgi:hypothetical protein
LRLLGSGFRYLGILLAQLYDLPLFIPLWWTARGRSDSRPENSQLHKVTS